MTGDWPWLTKCGNLQRSYSNVSKHADSGGGNRRACGGICHLCRAGQPGVPFEEISTRNPGWKQTVLEQTPFADEIPFEFVPHPPNELPLFFHFDLFHVWHLGVGRNFLGSALALLSGLENGGNVDLRFQQLSDKYLTWCSENGRTAHIQKLTKEHLGWQATTSYPTAGWHKGDLTTSLMLFVQSRFAAERWDGMLRDVGEAAVAINRYITLMFESGAWLEPEQAMEATNHGLRFLRRYNKNGDGVFGAGATLVDLASKNTRITSPHRAHAGRCRSRACSQRAVHVGSNRRRFHWTWEPIVTARRFRFYYVS